MTVSASNPSNLKAIMSTGSKSFGFSSIETRHKKFNTYSNSSLGKAAPFMKLEEAAPPIGKGNHTQTINDQDESQWSSISSPQINRLNFSQASQNSHLEIVSILATDILSYCSGVAGRDDSMFHSKKLINSIHISSIRGNADYCFIAGNCLKFNSLQKMTVFQPQNIPPQSAYLGNRCFPTFREQLPSDFQDYEYCESLLSRYSNQKVKMQIFNEEVFPENVIQGKFRTCSFAAALTALVNHDCLFDSLYLRKLITTITGQDFISIFFNGQEARLVPVTRRLLLSNEETFLNTHSEDFQSIGFSLIEKAVQILYASSDGSICSNMAIQLYHLTGWIPEVVFIKDITNHDFLWEMLSSNFREGNIMLGFGIKEMSEDEQTPANKHSMKSKESGLILNHAYPVLIFFDQGDGKSIQFKNPWGNSPAHRDICEQESISKSKIEEQEQGIFFLSWENVLKYFQSISLVWNPNIYPNSIKTHETWKNPYSGHTILTNHIYCLLFFPQFIVRIKPQRQNSEIRLLLERHQTKSLSQKKGIGVKLFQFESNRIAYTHQEIRSTKNAKETVNSDVFVFEASREYEEYVFAVFFDSLEPVINYSITIFSFSEVEVAQIPPSLMKTGKTFEGQWVENQELGAICSPTFLNSPQFKLVVERCSSLRIMAECDQDQKIQVMIISSDRYLEHTPLSRIEGALSPGFYFSRFSCCEAHLDEGEYIIVLANKRERVASVTNYKLYVQEFANSHGSWKIEKREEESKVMKQVVQGRWEKQNSTGNEKNLKAKNYQAIYNNPSYLLNFEESSSFQFYLQPLPKPSVTKPFSFHRSDIPACGILVARITIPGQQYEIEYSNDIYENRAFGFKTIPLQLEANEHGYIVVCNTAKKGYRGDFKLYVESPRNFQIQEYSLFMHCQHTKRIINKLSYREGSYGMPNYCLNSQYCLKPDISEIALHVFKSKGLPLTRLREETLLSPEGNYYQENCVAYVLELTKGVQYSLVPSNMKNEKQKDDTTYFVLTIGSLLAPFEVKEITQKYYESVSEFDILCDVNNGRGTRDFKLSLEEKKKCNIRAHIYTHEQNALVSVKLWEITDEGFKVKIQEAQSSFSMGAFLLQGSLIFKTTNISQHKRIFSDNFCDEGRSRSRTSRSEIVIGTEPIRFALGADSMTHKPQQYLKMAPKTKKTTEKKEPAKPEPRVEEETKEEVKAEKNSVDTTDSIRKVGDIKTQAVEASKEAVEHQLDQYKDKLGNTIDQSNVSQLEGKKAEQETTEEDPDSKSVWVKNVDYSAKAEELAEHFGDCGTISRVTIPVDKFNNNYPLGYAYIEFSDKDGQQKALNLHESLFKGRQLTVQEKRKNVPFRGRYRMNRGGAFNPLMAMYAMRSFGMMPGIRRSRGTHFRGY